MRLKTVVFYQGVKLWDGNLFQTVHEGDGNRNNKGVTISLENHVVTLECEGKSEIIIVGTSNMREARYWREPSSDKTTGKVSGESRSQNPAGNRTSGETAKYIPGAPEQSGQPTSVSTEAGSAESDGQIGVSEGHGSGDQAGNPSDATENDGGAAQITPAFDPKKYAGKTEEPKVAKPKRATKKN